MADNAVNRYEVAIDALKLDARLVADLKALGETLYRDTIREDAEHIEQHLDAMVADNPSDRDLAARVETIKQATASVKDGSNTRALLSEERLRG